MAVFRTLGHTAEYDSVQLAACYTCENDHQTFSNLTSLSLFSFLLDIMSRRGYSGHDDRRCKFHLRMARHIAWCGILAQHSAQYTATAHMPSSFPLKLSVDDNFKKKKRSTEFSSCAKRVLDKLQDLQGYLSSMVANMRVVPTP